MNDRDAQPTHDASWSERLAGDAVNIREASTSERLGGYSTSIKDADAGDRFLDKSTPTYEGGWFDSTPIHRD